MQKFDTEIQREVYQRILSSICQLDSLEQQIAVLANLFVQLGLSKMQDIPDGVFSVEEVAAVVIQDIEKHGESLANALARQGMILLAWIQEN